MLLLCVCVWGGGGGGGVVVVGGGGIYVCVRVCGGGGGGKQSPQGIYFGLDNFFVKISFCYCPLANIIAPDNHFVNKKVLIFFYVSIRTYVVSTH